MSELVTDEMVEAGSRAMSMEAHGIPDAYGEYTRGKVRAVLEAAAPLIAGRALRNAAGMFRSKTMPRQRLLDEAARIEKEAREL